MAKSALSSYVARINRNPRLTPPQERRLLRRFRREGDEAAARAVILSNLRVVVPVAQSFRHRHRNILELIQEGNLGLIRAVYRYDPDGTVTLAAYATSWVRTYVTRYVLSDFGLFVDESDPDAGFAKEMRRSLHTLEAEIGGELDDGSDESPGLGGFGLALDDPDLVHLALLVDQDHEPADVQIQERREQRRLEDVMATFERELTARELEIFRARLTSVAPATLSTTGNKLGLSTERVRQIEAALKRRLRTRVFGEDGKSAPREAGAAHASG